MTRTRRLARWRDVIVWMMVAVPARVLALAADPAPVDPLAGVVLQDRSGGTWRLGQLATVPVLLVVADRKAAGQARDWGERLAAGSTTLAPWRAPGKVAWVAIADLRRVPDYARESARDRIGEREAARSAGERQLASPLLLDWEGVLADRLGAAKGEALLLLLAPERTILAEVRGPPTDEGVTRLRRLVDAAAARAPAPQPE